MYLIRASIASYLVGFSLDEFRLISFLLISFQDSKLINNLRFDKTAMLGLVKEIQDHHGHSKRHALSS